jgi:hypothetical protein
MKPLIALMILTTTVALAGCDDPSDARKVAWVVTACENSGGQVTVNNSPQAAAVTCVLQGYPEAPETKVSPAAVAPK